MPHAKLSVIGVMASSRTDIFMLLKGNRKNRFIPWATTLAHWCSDFTEHRHFTVIKGEQKKSLHTFGYNLSSLVFCTEHRHFPVIKGERKNRFIPWAKTLAHWCSDFTKHRHFTAIKGERKKY